MLHPRQRLGSLYYSTQAFVVDPVRRGTRGPLPEGATDRNHLIFFGNILMNGVVCESRQRRMHVVEKNFDFITRRKLFDPGKDVARPVLVKHWWMISFLCRPSRL